MKKIILIILFFTVKNVSAQFSTIKIISTQTKPNTITVYNFKRMDTLFTIKLLKNNRVLFEEFPKQEIIPRKKTSKSRKKSPNKKRHRIPICGTQVSTYYQSYGTYILTNSKIILNFKDENPIEDIKVKILDNFAGEESNKVKVEAFDFLNDISIYQDNKRVCFIYAIEEDCEFLLTDRTRPLTLNFNGFVKDIDLPLEGNINVVVSINELKTWSHIKNKVLDFDIDKLNVKKLK